jgi:hypothetical protein
MAEVRGLTEAERRAIQQAVGAGDMKRAEVLLSGVRRRLLTSNRKKTKKKLPPAAGTQTGGVRSTGIKKAKSKTGSKTGKPGGAVRLVGSARFVHCPTCRREFSVNRDGRLRAHKNPSRSGKCHGSGSKVAKVWKAANSGSNSIRAVSGGLPGLGKRR